MKTSTQFLIFIFITDKHNVISCTWKIRKTFKFLLTTVKICQPIIVIDMSAKITRSYAKLCLLIELRQTSFFFINRNRLKQCNNKERMNCYFTKLLTVQNCTIYWMYLVTYWNLSSFYRLTNQSFTTEKKPKKTFLLSILSACFSYYVMYKSFQSFICLVFF